MRSFAIAALVGTASAILPTDPTIVRAGDAPTCSIVGGHTLVRYSTAFHKNFKCSHAGQVCSCVDHPTAAGDCKEFDHNGVTKRLSNDASCVATTTTTTTTTTTPAPQISLVAPEAHHIKYNGYCYITMDKCNVNTVHSIHGIYNTYGACGTTCQSGYLAMPAGYSLVPYSADLVQNVVKAGHFSTHVVVFSNGAGYNTRADTYTGDDPTRGTGKLSRLNMLSSSGNSYKTNACNLKVLMRMAC